MLVQTAELALMLAQWVQLYQANNSCINAKENEAD